MFYAHIAKGWTVGHTLSRILLRNIFGFPGFLIDCFLAIFWVPEYKSYWDKAYIPYSDDVRVGVMQGLLGWIGEALGYVIGTIIGPTLGAILYFPNAILMIAAWVQRGIYKQLNDAAISIGGLPFFEKFIVFNKPENYMQKAWNLGAGVLGTVIAFAPYVVAKILEFFLPFLGDKLSTGCIKLGGLIGGAIVGFLALFVFPVQFFIAKVFEAIDFIRDKIFSGIAVLYAKGNQKPTNEMLCSSSEDIHSDDFRDRVRQFNTTWTELLFGPLKPVAPPAAAPAAPIPASVPASTPGGGGQQVAFQAVQNLAPLYPPVAAAPAPVAAAPENQDAAGVKTGPAKLSSTSS